LKIIRSGISIEKPDGTRVTYYIFPEYEIHYNEIPPKTIQQWHYHKIIEETIYIISGELEFHWLGNGRKNIEKLSTGDIVRVEDTPHTLVNRSNTTVKFLVVRLVLSGKDNREIMKNDKYIVP
jgi:uncharacterized cupin superfamily protein